LTEVWSSAQESDKEPKPIRLEADACRLHFTKVRAQEMECDGFFHGHDVKSVYYEDLTENRASEMRDVQRFLGLRVQALTAQNRRQRTQPLSRAIANYEELKEVFAKSEWADFFGDTDR
jgi:hypothetical protein